MVILDLFILLGILVTSTIYYLISKEIIRINTSQEKNDNSFDGMILILILIIFWLSIPSLELTFIFNYIIYFYLIYFGYILKKKNIIFTSIIVTISLLFILLNYGLEWNKNNFFYIKLVEPFVVILIFRMTMFIDENKARSIVLNMVVIFILFVMNLYLINNYSNLHIDYSSSILVFLAFITLQILIIYYLEHQYERFLNKEKAYQKNEFNYYKPYLNSSIFNKLKNEFDNDLFFIFDIYITKENTILQDKHFHDIFQTSILNYYPETIFFMKDLKTYSMIIPSSFKEVHDLEIIHKGNNLKYRDKNDFLKQISDIVNAFDQSYSIKLYGSMYGLESNDIGHLFKINSFLSRNEFVQNQINNVILYDHRIYYEYFFEKKQLIDLLIEDKVSYRIFETNYKGNVLIQSEINELNNSISLYEKNLLQRYILNIQIEKLLLDLERKPDISKKIIVNLSYRWLQENLYYFIKRIEQKNVKDNIILNIDLGGINLNSKFELKKLLQIHKHFSIRLVDFNSSNIQSILRLQPDLISINSKIKLSKTRTKLKNEKDIFLNKDNVF